MRTCLALGRRAIGNVASSRPATQSIVAAETLGSRRGGHVQRSEPRGQTPDVASVPIVCQRRPGGSREAVLPLRSPHASPAPRPRAERHLPRYGPRRRRTGGLPGRRRAGPLRAANGANLRPVPLDLPCVLPANDAFPPDRPDPRSEPVRWNPAPERPVRRVVQRDPRAARPRLRRSVPIVADRDGRLLREGLHLRPDEPGASRALRSRGRVALDGRGRSAWHVRGQTPDSARRDAAARPRRGASAARAPAGSKGRGG